MTEFKRDDERHWQDDDLFRKLYGLSPESLVSEAHLVACRECSSRWMALRLARTESLRQAQDALVQETRLHEQRRALWARIDHPRRFWLSKWIPAAATSLMLAVGLVLLHPAKPLPAPVSLAGQSANQSDTAAPISDAELFSDLSAMALPTTPRAAEPIRGLFENSGAEEERSF